MEREFVVDDVFSLRRPKDIKAGIASGLKSVAKGVVGGTVGLLAAPAVGAVQEGLAGFAKGLATGVAGAVLLPVTGATVAAIQVARGVVNQPEAIAESIRGKAWDQERRCWIEQQQSAITPYDAAAALHWHRLGISGALACRPQLDYYELLEVSRDAPAEDIKRQYYKLARKHHPDKNVGDEQAHQRFQQLGEAYQVTLLSLDVSAGMHSSIWDTAFVVSKSRVLSSPQLRQQYDLYGVEGVQTDLMDCAAFFACLFGSEMFDHLVGELSIATMARLGEGVSSAELQEAQTRRVQQLTVFLAALLKRYEEGDVEGFKHAMQQEAERLAAASFGVTLLHCIGAVYSNQADIYLGGLWRGTLARFRRGTQSLRSHLNVVNAAIKVLAHQDKLAAFDRGCGQHGQQQQHEEACQKAHDAEAQQQQQQQQPAGVPQADLLYDTVWFGDQHAGGITADTLCQGQQQMPHQHAPSMWQQLLNESSTSSSGCVADINDCTAHAVDRPTVSLQYEALLESLPLNGCSHAGLSNHGTTHTTPSTCTTSVPSQVCSEAGACSTAHDAPDTAGRASSSQSQSASSLAGAAMAAAPADGARGAAETADCAMSELLQRSQLEEVSMQLCMEAMWAANVVDIQQTLGKVCQAVLFEGGSSQAVRQLRAHALRKLGAIFCSILEPANAPQVHYRHQVQAAYEAMLAKQMAQEDAMPFSDDDNDHHQHTVVGG